MAINSEELMGKFVRTGMIMRHIDGEGGPCPKRGPKEGFGMHGHDEGGSKCHGHGHGRGRSDHDAEPDGTDSKHHHKGAGHGHGHHGERRRGQARVLTMVSMQEGINQKDLAFLLGIRPQTLGEMLQKLEERELIERKKSQTDGRAIEVFLTDEGRTKASAIAERRALAATDIFAVLTDDEKEQLSNILDKLGAELDKHRPKGCGKRIEADQEDVDAPRAGES